MIMKKKTHSARELFRMRYPGGAKNFITPDIRNQKSGGQNDEN